LRADGKKALVFQGAGGDDDVTTRSPGIWLTVTYHWDSHQVDVEWIGHSQSPRMELFAAGIHRVTLAPMRPNERRNLDAAEAVAIREGLETTALLTVKVDGAQDGPLLVREEGMAWKPSILLTLSVADILRYWSALTREQRLALLETVASRDPATASSITSLTLSRHLRTWNRL
jgi:hypothetical protein